MTTELMTQGRAPLVTVLGDIMATHRKVRSIAACRILVCSVATLGVGALCVGIGHGDDCMGRFPAGRFGVPLSHEALASGRLAVEGFSPLYLIKRPVSVSRAESCDDLYTGDLFRLVETRAAGTFTITALVAGSLVYLSARYGYARRLSAGQLDELPRRPPT